MKRVLLVLTLLLAASTVGCAPTASGEASEVSLGKTSTLPVDTPVAEPTATLLPTDPPPNTVPEATPEPSPTALPAPTETATMLPAATPTHTPAGVPTVAPTFTPTTVSPDTVDWQETASYGLEVYRQQYCGVCHVLGAADTAGVFGPTHDGMGTTAEQRIHAPGYAGSAATAGEYIRESIVSPDAYLVPGYEVTSHHMPAYVHLAEGEIDALVQMLLQQR